MKKEVTLKNMWSADDKSFFIKQYLPHTRRLDRIFLCIAILLVITMLFEIVVMHQNFSDYIIAWIAVILLFSEIFFSNTINKRLLERVIHKHQSVILSEAGLVVDGIHYPIKKAIISNQFIFFRINKRLLIQCITKQETADIIEFVKEQDLFSITQTSKTFTITKFAMRKEVY